MNQPRPMYETEDDLREELKIIRNASHELDVKYEKLPISYNLDFALLSKKTGNVCSFAEVKRRKNCMDKYPTIFISMHKVNAAKTLFESSGIPSCFIVQWDDALGLVDISSPPCYVGWGGRSDRGDSADQEPMAHYNIDRVIRLDK